MSQYTQQANRFCNKYGVKVSAKFIKNDLYFNDDKETRDIFRITISRTAEPKRRFSFNFGQSISQSTGNGANKLVLRYIPSAYVVLTCITKNDPDTLENFCSNFGYDTDSRKAEKIYHACVKEWAKVSAFFSAEELEKLQEIQ